MNTNRTPTTTKKQRQLRCLFVSMAFGLVAVGCGDSHDASHDHPHAAETGSPTATVAPLEHAAPEEATAAEEMLVLALDDNVLSAAELEVFALEAVQCTARAGYESTLHEFDERTGEAVFVVGGDGPDEGPSDWAAAGCQTTYFVPAYSHFTQTSGESAEEEQLKQDRSEAAVLQCLRDAGHDFDDMESGLSSPHVSEDVLTRCVNAFFN